MNNPAPELIAKLPPELAAASIEHGAGMVKLSPYSEIAERSTSGVLRALRITLDAGRDVVYLMVSVLAHLAGGRVLRYPAGSAWMPEQLQPSYLLSPRIVVESKPARNARVLSAGSALASVVRLEDALWLVLRARHGCGYADGLGAVRAFIACLVRAGQDEGATLPNAAGKCTGPFIDVEAAQALGTLPEAQKTMEPPAAVIRAASLTADEMGMDLTAQVDLLVQHEMYMSLRDATAAELLRNHGLSSDESQASANVMMVLFVGHVGGMNMTVPKTLSALPTWLEQALAGRPGFLTHVRCPLPAGGLQFVNLVVELIPILAEAVETKVGLPQKLSLQAAHGFFIALATLFVGNHVYWPAMAAPKNTRRNELIVERLRTRTAKEVAVEFGISYVRVHQIYKKYLRTQDQQLRDELAQQEGRPAVNQRPQDSAHKRSAARVRSLATKEHQRDTGVEGAPIFASAQRYARELLQQRSDRHAVRQGARIGSSRSDD